MIDEIADGFFGKPSIVDTKLSGIKISIDTIKETQTQEDIVIDARDTINKIVLLEKYQGKIIHRRINNVVYTISSGSPTWFQHNHTIKHTAEVTGVYKLSVFSSAKFKILTTYPRRLSTDKFTGTVYVTLNRGDEIIFILVASDKKLTNCSNNLVVSRICCRNTSIDNSVNNMDYRYNKYVSDKIN